MGEILVPKNPPVNGSESLEPRKNQPINKPDRNGGLKFGHPKPRVYILIGLIGKYIPLHGSYGYGISSPTNHPFGKENDLPNLHFQVPC